jgi:hypothetical protein
MKILILNTALEVGTMEEADDDVMMMVNKIIIMIYAIFEMYSNQFEFPHPRANS